MIHNIILCNIISIKGTCWRSGGHWSFKWIVKLMTWKSYAKFLKDHGNLEVFKAPISYLSKRTRVVVGKQQLIDDNWLFISCRMLWSIMKLMVDLIFKTNQNISFSYEETRKVNNIIVFKFLSNSHSLFFFSRMERGNGSGPLHTLWY